MRQLVEQANRDIVARQAEGGALAAMRATVVFAVIDYEENHLIWAHSGDSRAYLFRSGALVARTTDHSLVEQLVSGGRLDEEGARRHPQRNILLSALGSVNDPPEISVSEHMKLEAGDAMLLCSDGVWEPLGDKCLQQTLMASRTLTQWSAEIDRQVQARAKPGHDNFTALAIWMVGGDGKTTQLIPSAADQPAAG